MGVVDLQRVLSLKGGRNFRDLGGYATACGRSVRWRMLFRTGVLSQLTEDDHGTLMPLGIRCVVDFRTLAEREREPARWPAGDTLVQSWNYDEQVIELRQYFSGAQVTPEVAFEAMCGFYRTLPHQLADQFAGLFEALAEAQLPLVFGCSAGKDRTGIAAALVLTSLGVPWAEVLADFVLTDEVVDFEKLLFARPGGSLGLGAGNSFLARLGPETRKPLLQAHPAYLEEAFRSIVREYGSVDDYLESRLGISADMREALRQQLLEPA